MHDDGNSIQLALHMHQPHKRTVLPPQQSSTTSHLHMVGMLRFVPDIKPTLLTPFYSVLVSISVFMALATVFLFINSSDNSSFSHSVLLVLSLPYWSFQLHEPVPKVFSTHGQLNCTVASIRSLH